MALNGQYDLLISNYHCRCGANVLYDGRFYVCPECHRYYCPECFGYILAEGGCFSCLNCGWSLCA